MAEQIKEQVEENNVAEAAQVVTMPKLKEPAIVKGAWWLVENWRKALLLVGVGAVAFVAGGVSQNAGEIAGHALNGAAQAQQLPASSSYGEEGPVEVPFAE